MIHIGTVLKTRDGCIVGNGYCYAVYDGSYFIETDFGNKFRVSATEAEKIWHPGEGHADTLSYEEWKTKRKENCK